MRSLYLGWKVYIKKIELEVVIMVKALLFVVRGENDIFLLSMISQNFSEIIPHKYQTTSIIIWYN